MMYDDIRGSWWDDPDDGEGEDDGLFLPIGDWFEDYLDMDRDYEPIGLYECIDCGRERQLGEDGRCSQCNQIWNG